MFRALRSRDHIRAGSRSYLSRRKAAAHAVFTGGFAGVIMAMLPNRVADEYITYIERPWDREVHTA